MPTQHQWLIGLAVFALTIIIIFLIMKRRNAPSCKKLVTSLAPQPAAPATTTPAPATTTPAVQPPEQPLTLQSEPEPLPPVPPPTDAPSQQTVESHRAELLRGTALARARVSAPTTSALIMNSALTGRDSHRQNIGETAVMDRLNSAPSQEAAPW